MYTSFFKFTCNNNSALINSSPSHRLFSGELSQKHKPASDRSKAGSQIPIYTEIILASVTFWEVAKGLQCIHYLSVISTGNI